MKLYALYVAALCASAAAWFNCDKSPSEPLTTVEDMRLCEKEGVEYFISKNIHEYNRINSEIEERRKHKNFHINPESCGLYALARAVNTPQPRINQISMAQKGLQQYSHNLETEKQTFINSNRELMK